MNKKEQNISKIKKSQPIKDPRFLGNKVEVKPGERGIALIMAIIIIGICAVFVANLTLSSQVGLQNAVATRDRVRSEYLAKSALNLADFMLTMDFAIDSALDSGVVPGVPIKGGDSFSDSWVKMSGIPLGPDIAELAASGAVSLGLSDSAMGELSTELKKLNGSFDFVISDESSKININYLAKGRSTDTIAMLTALFDCPVEKEYFLKNNINSKELIYRIKDFIDDDKEPRAESNLSGGEDGPYRKKRVPYNSKNAPFESLDELKKVEGWTDELHAIFSPYLTIYPLQKRARDRPKINVNTASTRLLVCFFPEAAVGECKSDSIRSFADRNDRSGTGLVDDEKAIGPALTKSFCNKDAKKAKWFTNKSDTFTIRATGRVGEYSQNIEALVRRKTPEASGAKGEPTPRIVNNLFWKLH